MLFPFRNEITSMFECKIRQLRHPQSFCISCKGRRSPRYRHSCLANSWTRWYRQMPTGVRPELGVPPQEVRLSSPQSAGRLYWASGGFEYPMFIP